MSHTRAGAEAWDFAGLDDFWKSYKPLTPWGKDEAQARTVLSDRKLIETRYDDIEAAMSFMRWKADEASVLDRVSYHLRRMPRLSLEAKTSYELLELFQIKKFMANYRGLVSVLGEDVAGRFGLARLAPGSASSVLAGELDRGGSDPETFYLADVYDQGLAEARAGVVAADAVVANERIKSEAEARLSFGVSFDGREFIVVPKATARTMMSACGSAALGFAVEPYDNERYIVRILPTSSALDAMSERERWLGLERVAEARVLMRISALASDAMPELRLAVAATTRWDRARAGADLAITQDMCRPMLASGSMSLVQARYIPCADECERMGLTYAPLTADFSAGAVVLFGSNMGGKTVVLKSLLFFQLLAQVGLFVPALRFETRVYERIQYVGELSGERFAGLSGFGLELWRLIATRASGCAGGTLVAFDELARTTGSHEASALLSAVVEAYSGPESLRTGDRAFFATHFHGVARVPGAEYRRMKGLDRQAATAALDTISGDASLAGAALAERLAGINRYMRYEIVDDDGSSAESDALAIASFLGLDSRIIERARFYLTKDGV
ncbi:hypothetical protein MASR2M48_30140 [Spirochaetota bacterium]